MKLIVAVTLAVMVSCVMGHFDLSKESVEMEFQKFTEKYGKVFSAQEHEHRRMIFRDNLERVNLLNDLKMGAEYGVTKFFDMSVSEFEEMYLNKFEVEDNVDRLHVSTNSAPTTFDWRDKNVVTPVKNQGSCGSCWAFSAVENIESQWVLAGHDMIDLAPQQLVDCDKVDEGCNGGLPWQGYDYIIQAKGLDTEKGYPYVGIDETCAFKPEDVGATISNWTMVSTNEDEIKEYLYTQGPLSCALNANWLQFYVGGISDPVLCNPKSLDHAVLLVGFGKGKNWLGVEMDYWLVRNSWGADWGEKGYFKLRRGDGKCGINTAVSTAFI